MSETDLRPGFRDISQGWMLVDDAADLDERIEQLARFTEANGGEEAMTELERETIKLMIETRVARGIRDGDFEPFIGGGV